MRIAVFMGELFMDYQSRLFTGLVSAAKEEGFKLDIFSNNGVFANNFLHTRGEINVINIPDLSLYDGIIVASDTLTVDGMYEDLHEKMSKEATCPIINLRDVKEEYYNVLVDDKTTIKKIVEHFITVHKFKNIFYMSGTLGMPDAATRLAGYKEMMANYNLPVRDTMIFHGNYWTTKAKQCLDWFAEDPEKPEAIVCANDYMALSLIRELEERGLKVPDDIKISGFDNIVEGQLISPRLTSADVPAEEMGKKAIYMMKDILEKKDTPKTAYVAAEPSMKGTCGCEMGFDRELSGKSYHNYLFLRDSIHTHLALSAEFENCESLEDVLRDGFSYSGIFGHKSMYICLSDGEDDESGTLGGFPDDMRLVAIFSKDNGFISCDEVFDKREIIPKHYRDRVDVLSVFALHFRGHCMGYIAIDIEDNNLMKEGFILWSNSLANYLDKIKMYEKNKELLRYKEESNIDSLTGLMNRRGLDIFMQKALNSMDETGMYIVSIDMDGLKNINDNFGHARGDYAIKALSSYLKSSQNDKVGSARTGGDEFVMVILGSEEYTKKIIRYIRKKIEAFNFLEERDFELSASIGYERFDPFEGVAACMNKADEKMYAEKNKKKAARK